MRNSTTNNMYNTRSSSEQTVDLVSPRTLTHQVGESFNGAIRAALTHWVPICRLVHWLPLSHELSQGHQENHGEEDLATDNAMLKGNWQQNIRW